MLNGWLDENDRAKHEPSESRMLIRQNCLYVLDGIDAEDMREGYRDDLLHAIPPDFCFPIDNGTT